MSFSDQVADLLAAVGVGARPEDDPDASWQIWTSTMPGRSDDDDVGDLVVYDDPGSGPDDRSLDADVGTRRPRFTIVVRARRYADAWDKANAAYLALLSVSNQTVGATRFAALNPTGDVADQGVDQSGRELVAFSVQGYAV